MEIPNNISTLVELKVWVESKKPKIIEIGNKSKLRKIVELSGVPNGFNYELMGQENSWKYYRGIPIIYGN